jgi:phage tail-like protein
MSRAISTDFYQNFRYHVQLVPGDGYATMPDAFKVQAGFNTLSIPELTMDAVEYREGTTIFTQKFSGIPTFSEVTMTRGVTASDSDFWRWGQNAAKGGEYRADLQILHFSREEASKGNLVGASDAWRTYICRECVPIRVKIAADMDATSGDVSIAEFGLAVESVQLFINGEAV